MLKGITLASGALLLSNTAPTVLRGKVLVKSAGLLTQFRALRLGAIRRSIRRRPTRSYECRQGQGHKPVPARKPMSLLHLYL